MSQHQLALVVYHGSNPFQDYPQLRSIWPEPYRSISESAVVEHLALAAQYEIGDIFLILHHRQVVGITGYFPFDEQCSALGLRWHGLIDEARGHGLSRETLARVAALGMKRFPSAADLIELVPLNDYGKPLETYFSRLGFKADGNAETYDWIDHPWQPYRIPLADLASRLEMVNSQRALEPRRYTKEQRP